MRRALPREEVPPARQFWGSRSGDDPFARAAAKIAAAQERVAAQRQETERRERAAASPEPPTDPVRTAYKIIGVPNGSDFLTVEWAVNKLRERCSPTRFPNGSSEQADAQVILQRVEEAFPC